MPVIEPMASATSPTYPIALRIGAISVASMKPPMSLNTSSAIWLKVGESLAHLPELTNRCPYAVCLANEIASLTAKNAALRYTPTPPPPAS